MSKGKAAVLGPPQAGGCGGADLAANPHGKGDVAVWRLEGRNTALRRRYRAAIKLLPDCETVDERIELLIAIVWPEDEKLRAA